MTVHTVNYDKIDPNRNAKSASINTKRFEASPFSLNMFQQCPRQYRYQYIDHLGDIYRKARPYFTMGDHVHATLKDFLSVVPVSERNLSKLEDRKSTRLNSIHQ